MQATILSRDLSLCIAPIDTFQGEHPGLGFPVRIVRFAGCNLGAECPLPCDTPNSWLDNRVIHTSVGSVLEDLEPWRHLMITGGEPFLYPEEVSDLVTAYLTMYTGNVIIETNGTLITAIHEGMIVISHRHHCEFPTAHAKRILLSISPKTTDSFRVFFQETEFPFFVSLKVVVAKSFPPFEWDPYIHFCDTQRIPIYLMSMGAKTETLRKNLDWIYKYANRLQLRRFVISPRAHILMGVA